jgi:2-oxoglutarate dehydrogenase E2 component (dihydrolipoamide succinyltransferase)
MMREIKVPRLAESISEAVVVAWLKPEGAAVAVDEPVVTLETDKAAVEIPSEFAGRLSHTRAIGDRVQVGDVLARVEEGAPAAEGAVATPPAPASAPAAAAPTPGPASAAERVLSPAVRRMVEEHGIDPDTIPGTGPRGRVLKEDVQRAIDRPPAAAPPGVPMSPRPVPPTTPAVPRPATAPSPAAAPPRPALVVPRPPAPTQSPGPDPAAVAPAFAPARAPSDWGVGESERAVPMSRIRQRIAERLVLAQQTAAILTTFNEVDMSAVMSLRERYRDDFERRHGVRLSYMGFFTRACIISLQQIPELNAMIRDKDILYRRHVHMGIAVGTERGLVVPVVRDADQRSFAELEREIARLGASARAATLSLDELSGGTFTISNGGVYGSLLSTPILNFPQSGILGMHKIEKRPVAIDDQVVIRPMMYLALSYDHRIVDGEQAVTFLVSVKQRLEDPERMLIDV